MPGNIWMRIGVELAVGILLALLLRRFVCVLSYVQGKSMLNTLRGGEVLFALRYGLVKEIRRFDVVICRFPDRKGFFVKRVIALPGERISMEEDRVFINGEPLEENFARRRSLRKMEEMQLGPDEYFVMGDNRPISRDSRKVGPLRRSQVLAKCCAVVFPPKKIRRLR